MHLYKLHSLFDCALLWYRFLWCSFYMLKTSVSRVFMDFPRFMPFRVINCIKEETLWLDQVGVENYFWLEYFCALFFVP